jgi:RimJ/RimL family protein N-acetyltransferase
MKSDIELIRVWRNAQMAILRQPKEISSLEQVKYFEEKIWPSMEHQNPLNILMTLCIDSKPIGYGGLVHINWTDERAEISFLVSPDRAANHDLYAADQRNFIELIRKVAFEDLHLNRLYTETYDVRPRHIQTLQECGFVLEGAMKSHAKVGDVFVNSLIHGMLNLKK